LLKDRLVRRGLTPTENSLGMLLAADGARAAVPEPLAAATVRAAAALVAGGKIQTGTASGSVLALMNVVLRAAVVFKLKATASVLLGIALVGVVAAGVGGWASVRNQPGERGPAREPAVASSPNSPPIGNHRPADEIVKEIDALLKTTLREVGSREKLDQMLRARSQIAALVEELWTAYPDDSRLTRYLPERWECLTFSKRKADIYAEISAVLRSAKDRVLKKEALLFETGLRLLEPIDGRTAVSLAEAFRRHAPDDNRAGELFRLATAKLDDDWHLRLGLIVLLALAGVFTLSAMWIRRVRLRVCLKLALGLGGLVSVVLVVLLITFQFLTYDWQNAIYGFFSGWRNLFSDPTLQRKARFIAFSLLYKVPEQLESIGSSIWAGLTVAMALATALGVVVGHRRFAGGSMRWTSTIRLAVLGFVGVLAVSAGLDALPIARQRSALGDRIMRDYPDVFKDRLADGQRRQHERIGEPFELEFADAITGRRVSIKALRGKVVVVDFWASYGGLLGGHISKMKRLYAEYHDKGVEFIGVSLDHSEEHGGLDELKAFVAKEQVPWPHFYEDLEPQRAGNRPGPTDRLLASIQHYYGFDSNRGVTRTAAKEFSDSWGIHLLPTVFLIDTEGKLYSTEAEGQLETLLQHVLKQTRFSPADR
jgi:hypothetical protein